MHRSWLISWFSRYIFQTQLFQRITFIYFHAFVMSKPLISLKIMRWSRNHSVSWAERFRTSSLLCTYKLCDYYSLIPILSPFLFTSSLYMWPLSICKIFHLHCIQQIKDRHIVITMQLRTNLCTTNLQEGSIPFLLNINISLLA